MKLGTWIQLPDGREGTVVFNGLCGMGIKWGRHDPDPSDFEGSVADLGDIGVRSDRIPVLEKWTPDALLRDPWPGCERSTGMECVGGEFEVVLRGAASDLAGKEPSNDAE